MAEGWRVEGLEAELVSTLASHSWMEGARLEDDVDVMKKVTKVKGMDGGERGSVAAMKK